MNKQNILNLFDRCDFNNLTAANYIDKIICKLPLHFIRQCKVDKGVTKLVLLPENQEYVIKIPFQGRLYNDNDSFMQFSRANHDSKHCWDYCYTETCLYHCCKQSKIGIHKMFAKTSLLGYAQGFYPIYLQQKVTELETTYSDLCSTIDFVTLFSREHSIYSPSPEQYISKHWHDLTLQYYGTKKYLQLIAFIADNRINDLHCNNLGYLHGRPVIIDYSSFYE